MLVLVFSCLTIPYRVAFVEVETTRWIIINNSVDIVFLFDIIIIFNTAYFDDDFQIIDNRKSIAKMYLKGWFFVDIISILPIELFLKTEGAKYNQMIRITRIGRMYKIIKLLKLMRIAKFAKC